MSQPRTFCPLNDLEFAQFLVRTSWKPLAYSDSIHGSVFVTIKSGKGKWEAGKRSAYIRWRNQKKGRPTRKCSWFSLLWFILHSCRKVWFISKDSGIHFSSRWWHSMAIEKWHKRLSLSRITEGKPKKQRKRRRKGVGYELRVPQRALRSFSWRQRLIPSNKLQAVSDIIIFQSGLSSGLLWHSSRSSYMQVHAFDLELLDRKFCVKQVPEFLSYYLEL